MGGYPSAVATFKMPPDFMSSGSKSAELVPVAGSGAFAAGLEAPDRPHPVARRRTETANTDAVSTDLEVERVLM
jgi:hypothetical protein